MTDRANSPQPRSAPLSGAARGYILMSGSPFFLLFGCFALSSFLLGKVQWQPGWGEKAAHVYMTVLLLLTEASFLFWAIVVSSAAAPALYPSLSPIVGWHHKALRQAFSLLRFRIGAFDRALILYNNRAVWRLYQDRSPAKILLLISRCIQGPRCTVDLSENIEDCRRCGKCQLPELIDLAHKHYIEISFNPRTEDAMRRVKDYRPDLAIGVACENRLVKGLLGTLPGKAYLVQNSLSGKGCLDNKVPLELLRQVLDHFC